MSPLFAYYFKSQEKANKSYSVTNSVGYNVIHNGVQSNDFHVKFDFNSFPCGGLIDFSGIKCGIQLFDANNNVVAPSSTFNYTLDIYVVGQKNSVPTTINHITKTGAVADLTKLTDTISISDEDCKGFAFPYISFNFSTDIDASTYTNIKRAVWNFSGNALFSLNSPVINTKLSYNGSVYDVVINHDNSSSTDMNILLPAGLSIPVLGEYTLPNIITGKVPSSQFTAAEGETNNDLVYQGTIQKRLMLPVGTPYIQTDKNLTPEQIKIAILTYDDIYPRFSGQKITSVSSVDHEEKLDGEVTAKYPLYTIGDKNLAFDKNCILENTTPIIIFQTGLLAGNALSLTYLGTTGGEAQFRIEHDEKLDLPNNMLKPSVGDEYVLKNIDTSYYFADGAGTLEDKAEQELLEQGEKDAKDILNLEDTFDCSMISNVMKKGNISYQIGQKVTLRNNNYFAAGTRDSRVIGYEICLDKPYDKPVYSIGNSVKYSLVADLENKIEKLKFNGGTYYGVSGGSNSSSYSIYVVNKSDTTKLSDTNVMSSLRAIQELDDRALSKQHDDRTEYNLGVGKNLKVDGDTQFGKSYVEGMTGVGGKIDENANAELESLTLRRFLQVPEIDYNRVDIKVGDKWRAPGGGVIKSVDTDNKIVTLKLEDGEIGAVEVGDICMGIFHSTTTTENSTSNVDDSKGNRTFAGFFTCYFHITEVLDTNHTQFKYELRPIDDNWKLSFSPCEAMNFVCYGNFTNVARQTSVYETTTYTRMLVGQNTWEFSVNNIAMQYGNLTNLNIFGLDMTGYSIYLANIYMKGAIKQVKDNGNEIKQINFLANYTVGQNVDYYDALYYNGSTWVCINKNGTNTTPSENDTTNWMILAKQGESVKVANEYQEDTTYTAGTILSFYNMLFAARVDTQQPPLEILSDQDGTYITDENGNYLLYVQDGDVVQNNDWILLIDMRTVANAKDGQNGESLEVRYSSDKSNWHEVYLDGDIWMQQRVGSNNVWSSAMRIVGESGTDGVDGKYTVYEFAKNTSTDIAPTSGWQDAPMATSIGEYLWMRSGVVIPPATTPSSWAAVRLKGDKGDKGDQGIQGLQGIQGPNGDQGIQGPNGDTGATSYFHVKYSDYADGTNMNENGGAYIGTYVDFTAVDSTDPTKYTWVLVKGAQGAQGNQGIAGQNGVNGQTSYLHIAYATSADGKTGFSQTSGTYIGQYVDFTQADSTDPTKYTWTLIKGDKGDSGDSVKLLYRYEIDKPTKPTGSNPNGWSNTPDKEIITITHGTNFTLKDGYYVSPAISDSSIIKNRIYFSTTKVNQSIAIELSVSSEPNFDCALIGILDDNNLTINSNYTKKISGITTIIAIVDIPNIGSHFIDVGYAKDNSVSNNDDNCKYRIVDINKCWISTGYTISGLTTWSDPVIFINDNKSEEYIYAIEDSEITLASPKSDKYIDDFIPKRTYTDYSQSLTWTIGSEVIYNSNYYRCIIANSSTNVHLPTETLYWKQIEPWTDNPQGVSLTKKYEYISKRTKVNGVWGEFSIPTIWARYSVDGNDGDKGDKGDTGDKGIQGCVLRDSEWVEGTQYLNQSNVKQDGIRYIDVALIANSNATTGWDAYLCLQDHIASASNKPVTTGGNTYWELFSANVTAIFTSLIIAKNAKIKFLQGNQLLLMDSVGDIVGGLSGFSTDSNDVRLWIGGSNPSTAPYRVMEDGSVVATKMLITGDSEIRDCRISGTLNGVSGTFNYLQGVGSNGKFWFDNTFEAMSIKDEDFRQLGRKNNRTLRLYASNIRCSGSFGASSLNMARVHDTYIDYFVNGDTYSYIRSNLESNGVGGYYIQLYPTIDKEYSLYVGGTSLGDVQNFPVDLLIFDNSGTYHYEMLPGACGKKVTVINAHDGGISVYLAINGNLNWPLYGGMTQQLVNIRELTNPLISSSVHGAGWMLLGGVDNNWT